MIYPMVSKYHINIFLNGNIICFCKIEMDKCWLYGKVKINYGRFESDKSDNKISQGLKHFQPTWQLFQINLPFINKRNLIQNIFKIDFQNIHVGRTMYCVEIQIHFAEVLQTRMFDEMKLGVLQNSKLIKSSVDDVPTNRYLHTLRLQRKYVQIKSLTQSNIKMYGY